MTDPVGFLVPSGSYPDTPQWYKALSPKPYVPVYAWADGTLRLEPEPVQAVLPALDEEHCVGAEPMQGYNGMTCPTCDLFIPYSRNKNENRNHEILMRGEHWNRPDKPGANPFTKSGLYGKAAEAADGDWYGSH